MQTCRWLSVQGLLAAVIPVLLSGCLSLPVRPVSESANRPDPYLWLEAPVTSTRVSAWLQQQAQTRYDWLQQQSSYQRLRTQLRSAWDHPKWMVADIQRDQVFFYYNTGLQDHYSLYQQPFSDFIDDRDRRLPPTDSARLLLDGMDFSAASGPVAVSISPDAEWLAYQINQRSPAGQLQTLWYLQSLQQPASDPLLVSVSHGEWTLPAEQIAWDRHAEYLLFAVSVPTQAAGWQSRVHALELDDMASAPRLIHSVEHSHAVRQMHVLGNGTEPGGEESGGQSLLLAIGSGTDSDLQWCLRNLEPMSALGAAGRGCQSLAVATRAERFVGAIGGVPAFISIGERGTGAVTVIDGDQRRELISETEAPLHAVQVVGQTLVLEYLIDGSSVLRIADLQGRLRNAAQAPALPAPVRIDALRATGGNRLLMSYSGLLTPPRSVLIDPQNGQQTLLTQDRPDLAVAGLQARLALVSAGDVRVPVWVAGAGSDVGQVPAKTLLEVYGGFSAPMDTSFSISRLVWLVNGGGYAVAGPRGGGDYGERWHEAGRGEQRHRSIADVLTVADWLRSGQVAGHSRLAIGGRSHGGLLAAEAVHSDPDMFAALIAEAAVFDLARLDELGGARFWHAEYRGADVSPYQRLLDGGPVLTEHPPTLLITRDNDAVVSAAHSFKYLRALQAEPTHGRFDALLSVVSGQQHQNSGRVDDIIDDYAMRWAFLNSRLAGDAPSD